MPDKFHTQVNETLMEIYNSIGKVEDRMLQSSVLDLSICELDMVSVIAKRGNDGASISQIAKDLGVTLPTVTVAVQRLEAKDFVEKARCSQDARKVNVVLTRMGKKADAAHRYFHERMVRSLLAGVDDEQKQLLLSALRNLGAFLRGIGEAEL